MDRLELPLENWAVSGACTAENYSAVRRPWHHAVQLAAMPGRCLLAAKDDDSHTNLGWEPALNALSGRALNDHGFRVAVQLDPPAILLLEGENNVAAVLPLPGTTLSEGFDWVRRQLKGRQFDSSALTLDVGYSGELPDHPYAGNSSFPEIDQSLTEALAVQFSNAETFLTMLRRQIGSTASEVRCWPHHLDIATLVTLDSSQNSHDLESIGIGFSPGDQSSPMPYYYVTPWPYPDATKLNLPELPGAGAWNTDGWVGASLPIGELQRKASDGKIVADFLKTAIGYWLTANS